MAAQYLLPCTCGSETTIDTSQAGSSVVCACGKTLDVPSLRAIRQLPADDAPGETRTYEWSRAAGLVFACGMIVALIGLATTLYSHFNLAYLDFVQPPEPAQVEAWIEELDETPPDELFEMWTVSRDIGLGEYRMSPALQARTLSQKIALNRNIGLIMLACGLVFAAMSPLLRRKAA